MHSNPLTGDDREVVRLDVEYGLQEKVYVNEKGTYHVDDLTAQCLHAETFNESTGTFVPHSLDGPFWCCNDKVYGGICESGIKVVIQGDRCGECAVRSSL